VVGRVRGEPPTEITLRWRDAAGPHEERRPLEAQRVVDELDLRRRWAAARVDEIALRGKGREAATDVAVRASLLTPWTAWIIGGGQFYLPPRFPTRVLDLASDPESAGFAAILATPRSSFGALTDALHATQPVDDDKDEGDDAYKAAVAAASRRIIGDAGDA